ncbi:hypothetical protein [Alcanivorax sp. S71-1-4]|uniref:hypothetical protein n=1 Tax=Alcanivorax sp. S71-1-4 TaxID=1177159 RepID=UPI001359B4CB|nr:hypothetical protein [Alcanivorax sp. S71-1-4]
MESVGVASLPFKNGSSQVGMTASNPTERDEEDGELRAEDEKSCSPNEEAKTEVEIEKGIRVDG